MLNLLLFAPLCNTKKTNNVTFEHAWYFSRSWVFAKILAHFARGLSPFSAVYRRSKSPVETNTISQWFYCVDFLTGRFTHFHTFLSEIHVNDKVRTLKS